MGISIKRYLAPSGTAGFARSLVKGYSRVPAPPPKIMANTRFTSNLCGTRLSSLAISVGYPSLAAESMQRSAVKSTRLGRDRDSPCGFRTITFHEHEHGFHLEVSLLPIIALCARMKWKIQRS